MHKCRVGLGHVFSIGLALHLHAVLFVICLGSFRYLKESWMCS